MKFIYILLIQLFAIIIGCSDNKEQPNVILILTDDQGYGDLSCHGNPWLKTPNIDSLNARSFQFSDFHVGTTCAPTRAGLMTGKYCNKVGVWHTINGRSLLRQEEKTIADVLGENGYATGIFGKWHLGDNYPYRPQDRGFQEVLVHGGGGVGQTPDYWNNDYFDDTYFNNGQPKQYNGYCTDVFFNESMKWIKNNGDKPFFCYLSTNAPHGPLFVEEKYSTLYSENDSIKSPQFYGMIANIDENVGRLVNFLKENDLYENTILIFMTDNGTIDGALFKDGQLIKGYNAGMKGLKGSPYEGGHRVPFMISWPEKYGFNGRKISSLSAYIDVFPTLLDMIGIETLTAFDGMSLKPILDGQTVSADDRFLVVDTQREEFLKKEKSYVVMTEKWRFVNNRLFDIKNDPFQENDLSHKFPEVAMDMESKYHHWWESVSVNRNEIERIRIHPKHLPTVITTHDTHMESGLPAWNQYMIREGKGDGGYWAVEIEEEGTYKFELYRWPPETKIPLVETTPPGEDVPGDRRYPPGVALDIYSATMTINRDSWTGNVDNEKTAYVFEAFLSKGPYDLRATFKLVEGSEIPVYYIKITKVDPFFKSSIL